MNYASTSDKRLPTTLRLLHRFVMNAEKGKQVDHIEGNTLDMRKSELRVCTSLENGQNKALSVRGTCGVKGVCWDKRSNKWIAHIRVNYHHKTLGYFNTIEEAAEARRQAEILLQGDFSRDYRNENGGLSLYDENGERLNKREINHTKVNCTHCVYWNENKDHMCSYLQIIKKRWNKCDNFMRKEGY